MKKTFLLLCLMTEIAFSLNASAPNDRVKIACIGNSITNVPGLAIEDNYPAQLEAMLSDSFETANFGSPGATMLKNGDQPYWDRNVFSDALNYNPDIVIVKLGTNDSKPVNWDSHSSELIEDYSDMIDTLRTLETNPLIWVCFPVPAFSSEYNINNENLLFEIIPDIEYTAFKKCVCLIDLYSALEGKSDVFPDGIHPDSAGAFEIANKVFQAIDYETPVITKENNVLTAPESRYYRWYLNYTALNDENNGDARILHAGETGTYTVTIKPWQNSEDMIVSNPVEIGSSDLETSTQKRKFTTNISRDNKIIQIYGLSGKKYMETEAGSINKSLISEKLNIPQGIYLIRFPQGMVKLPVVH